MAAISVGNTVSYFVAVDRMSPALVTLVIYVYPALAVLFSRLLGWTQFRTLTAVAVASTIGGVVLTIGLPDGSIDGLAIGLCLVNGTCFACWLLLAQAALRRADALTCFAAATGAAQLVILVGSFLVSDPEFGTGTAVAASVLGAGIVSTVVAFMLQLHGIARLGGAATALVTTLEIITVVVLSAVLFDDPIGPTTVVGALLVLAGAALAPISVRPAAPPR
jgi:drug/metabolite transporter (DMT)-like permease